MTISVTGTIAGAGAAASTLTSYRYGMNSERGGKVRLSGAGAGTVQMERSGPNDNGVFAPIYAAGTQLYVWNYAGQIIEEDFSESIDGTQYRLNCTAFTSGPINWELGQ